MRVNSLAWINPIHEICKCAIDGKNFEEDYKQFAEVISAINRPQGIDNNFVKLPSFSWNLFVITHIRRDLYLGCQPAPN